MVEEEVRNDDRLLTTDGVLEFVIEDTTGLLPSGNMLDRTSDGGVDNNGEENGESDGFESTGFGVVNSFTFYNWIHKNIFSSAEKIDEITNLF